MSAPEAVADVHQAVQVEEAVGYGQGRRQQGRRQHRAQGQQVGQGGDGDQHCPVEQADEGVPGAGTGDFPVGGVGNADGQDGQKGQGHQQGGEGRAQYSQGLSVVFGVVLGRVVKMLGMVSNSLVFVIPAGAGAGIAC